MSWCQLYTLWRHQVNEGLMIFFKWCVLMDRADHLLILLRTTDRKNGRVKFTYLFLIDSHTTGDDNPSIFIQCLANGVQ